MVIPVVATVSRWAQKTSVGPSPSPASATALGRLTAASSSQLRMPRAKNQSRANPAMPASPCPSSGASAGLTDGIRISCWRTSRTLDLANGSADIARLREQSQLALSDDLIAWPANRRPRLNPRLSGLKIAKDRTTAKITGETNEPVPFLHDAAVGLRSDAG